MVLVPLGAHSEQSVQRSKTGRLQIKRPARQGNTSKPTRRSTAESFHPESKSPKALKNKNWRARRDGQPAPREPMSAAGKEVANGGSETEDESRPAEQSRSAVQRLNLPTISSSQTDDDDDLIQIVNKLELLSLPDGGGGMSLLEVVTVNEHPHTAPEEHAATDDHAEIARILQVQAETVFFEPQPRAEQPPDILTASPHQLPNIISNGQTGNGLYETFRTINNPASQTNSIPEDQNRNAHILSGEGTELDPSPSNEAHHVRLAALYKRNIAFKRMIERLNTGKALDSKRGEGGYEGRWPFRPEYNRGVPSLFRKPVSGSGRRHATNSDFRINYWDRDMSSQDYTEANDSDAGTEVKHNNLNPRAREFLSIGYNQNFMPPQPSANLPQRRAMCSDSSSSDSINASALEQFAPTGPTTRSKPYKTCPSRGGIPSFAPGHPQQLGVGFDANLNTHQFLQQQLPNSLLQSAVYQAPLGFPLVQTLQPLGTSMFGRPMLPTTFTPAGLASTTYLRPLGLSNLPQQTMANPQRPAVPKPRVPNTNSQQAYEEWIEWRKANEPGYAIECKVRQQKRSQRNKISKPRHETGASNQTIQAATAA